MNACYYADHVEGQDVKCQNRAVNHYHMNKLSDTLLCEEHSIDADNNRIVKLHLIRKEKLT